MTLRNAILCGAASAGLIAFSAAGASADVVCSGRVCWHTHDAYEYPRGAHVIVHPDDWRWGAREHFAWREHEGRGYWRGSRWMEW
jgi:hypothetical protein